MMLRVFLLLLFSSFTQNIFSQFYIRGHVTDSESQPLRGASVYINNTTKGTVADDNGDFELGLFEPGRYEIVASFVGYDPVLYSAEIKTSGIRIIFKLEKKEETLREVLVLTSETRKKYLDIFKEYVLGLSVAADHCQIKNIEEVQFTSGETKDEIVAYTEKALVIENPELGYTIHFDLLNFSYNKRTNANFFYGYTRFVDWDQDGLMNKKWLRKRRQAYNGSTVHFFRSLVNKQLNKNGFTVYQLVKPKQDSMVAKYSTKQISVGVVTVENAIEDSLISLYSDSIYKVYQLNIKDGWRVRYSKETDLKTEILKKGFRVGQPPTGTLNGLRVRRLPILISEKGIILTPINVYYDGIWSYERLANMLPEDYEVE